MDLLSVKVFPKDRDEKLSGSEHRWRMAVREIRCRSAIQRRAAGLGKADTNRAVKGQNDEKKIGLNLPLRTTGGGLDKVSWAETLNEKA